MKRKIKLLSLLLSFSLTLTTISCQVEEDVVSSKNQSEIKVKKIKENRINNYSFALEKINTINNVKKENINSKIIIDPVLDILIDTEEAMLIEGDNFTSLTFPVYRENSNDFENLVVQQMDNTTKTYLVNYGPNKEAAMNGQNTNASIREIAFNTENLNNKIFYSSSNTVVYSDETGNLNYYCDETYEITNEYGYMDVANPSTGESTITLINSTCSYYWSFHYSTGGGAGGSSSNNHGGLGAGTGSTTVTTAPITTTMAAQIVKEFVKNLSPTQFAWWTNPVNDDAVASISSYLPQVDADPAFAMELIDYGVENNNSQESIEEITNILDLINDGKINGEEVLVGPDTPITNMSDYLSCFNTSQGATITIYADQPKNGSHNLYSQNDGVGHAFISIKQGDNIATLGFYPQSSVGSIIPNNLTLDPTDFFSTPGVFGNNQGHTFDVSLTVPINSSNLTNLINGIITVAEDNPIYNLGSLNCTDFVILAIESNTNINIPNCESPRPYWNGQTPGTLGEVIRNMPTPAGGSKNTDGGNAPNNNCN